jgi:hypothetical protein
MFKIILRVKVKDLSKQKAMSTNRVMPLWNDLLVEVKEAKTLDRFKARLDKLKAFTV